MVFSRARRAPNSGLNTYGVSKLYRNSCKIVDTATGQHEVEGSNLGQGFKPRLGQQQVIYVLGVAVGTRVWGSWVGCAYLVPVWGGWVGWRE